MRSENGLWDPALPSRHRQVRAWWQRRCLLLDGENWGARRSVRSKDRYMCVLREHQRGLREAMNKLEIDGRRKNKSEEVKV